MTRDDLRQYRSLKIEIKDLEVRIDKIQNASNCEVIDKVKGSQSTFPYIQRSFTIEGEGESDIQHQQKLKLKLILLQKKNELEDKVLEIEEYIQNIQDSELSTIYRMYYLDGMAQEAIADRIGYTQRAISKKLAKEF